MTYFWAAVVPGRLLFSRWNVDVHQFNFKFSVGASIWSLSWERYSHVNPLLFPDDGVHDREFRRCRFLRTPGVLKKRY